MVTRYCRFLFKGKNVGTLIVPENSSAISREITAIEGDIKDYDAIQLFSATDDRHATPASESSILDEAPTKKSLPALQKELIEQTTPSYLKL
jgi:hypothetical protein